MFPRADTAIQDHLRNTQSTHGSAAQASAARLILLLRKAFSRGQQTNPFLEELEILEKLANHSLQIAVVNYQDQNKNIRGILGFIDYILQAPGFEPAQCKQVVANIVRLVKLGRDHWTQNSYYPDGATTLTIVDASLGETLNLVSLATFDVNAYEATAEGIAQDTHHRVISLFNYLLNLPPICTGGRQHDLLFLLNNCWGKIKLIEDIRLFLYGCSSIFLSDALKRTYPNTAELFHFLLPWIITSAGLAVAEEGNYVAWLESQKAPLEIVLKTKCSEYGLNSAEPPNLICDFISCLSDMNVPDDVHPGITLARNLLKAENPVATSLLGNQRHGALGVVKKAIPQCVTADEVVTRFNCFSQALQVCRELESCSQLTISLDDEGQGFQAAKQKFEKILICYFEAIKKGMPNFDLPADFEEKKRDFYSALKQFKEYIPIELIKNLFAFLQANDYEPQDIAESFNYLKLFKEKLRLSDTLILEWFMQNQVHTSVVAFSPYEINRFILHALWFHPRQWSPLFCDALFRIVEWLSQPSIQNDAPSDLLNAVRDTYPKKMLKNLSVVLCIAKSDLVAQEKDDLYRIAFTQNSTDIYWEYFSLVMVFKLLGYVYDARWQSLWKVIQPNLKTLIVEGRYLILLLNREQVPCTEILTILQPHFASMINTHTLLGDLLGCRYLTDEHRTQILAALQSYLPTIIKDRSQLEDILICEYLTDEHRTRILTALLPHLATIIKNNTYELIGLLSREYLIEAQRTEILTALQPHFVSIIKTHDRLRVLLEGDLPDTHRTQILDFLPPPLQIMALENEILGNEITGFKKWEKGDVDVDIKSSENQKIGQARITNIMNEVLFIINKVSRSENKEIACNAALQRIKESLSVACHNTYAFFQPTAVSRFYEKWLKVLSHSNDASQRKILTS